MKPRQMPNRDQLWHGYDKVPQVLTPLRAGPVTAYLDGVDLRYICLNNQVELVRRIYVAVRDQNWGTVPAAYSNLTVTAAADHFEISFDARHQEDAIDFRWHGTITGRSDGSITYLMDGLAETDFLWNRIGICVLHPPDEAGRPFRARTPSGEIEGLLPEVIGPQRIVDGNKVGLFPPFTALTIDLAGNADIHFEFSGDLFEMEDQRNWTDASFKTYSTPLALPYPKHAQAGQQFKQSVSMTPSMPRVEFGPQGEEEIQLVLAGPLGHGLPAIGFGMASHGGDLSVREADLLRQLNPDHLRVELHLEREGWPHELARGVRACRQLACPMELILFLSDATGDELDRLAPLLAPLAVARVMIFHEREKSTPGYWVQLARDRLRPALSGVPVAGGTNAFFTEINAMRPEVAAMAGIAYSLNPQVHAFDDTSLVETLEAQGTTVRSARAFSQGRPLFVGPVTLKPRFNPNATGPEPLPMPGELPPQVDPRQMSLFGAGWTVGSIKYLGESGADSVTYYETTGWRGLVETENGSPLPALFPSAPGMIFPLYYVFRDVATWKGEMVRVRSSRPLEVIGLTVLEDGVTHVLLSNLTSAERSVSVGPISGTRARVRRLNEATAAAAMFEPEQFLGEWGTARLQGQALLLTLAPYETIRVDVE